MNELVVMRLFAEMEVRCDGMLEEVNDEVAEQNQQGCRSPAQFQTLRDHFDKRGGQHKSCAECDEVAQVAPLPIALHDDGAAEDVGGGGGKAEKHASGNRIHIVIVRGAAYCFFTANFCFCNSERNACSRSAT